MPPVIYQGRITSYSFRGGELRIGLADGLRLHVPILDVSANGLELIQNARPPLELSGVLRDSAAASVEWETDLLYLAHFFAEVPRFSDDTRKAGIETRNPKSLRAAWEFPGYQRIASLLKNAQPLKIGHPLFPDFGSPKQDAAQKKE